MICSNVCYKFYIKYILNLKKGIYLIKMENLKKQFIRYWPFFLIIFILFVVNANQIINNHSVMIFNTDSYAQSLQFYLGGWEKLRSFDFSLWDWTSGYGANYFNHVYYFATSPFFLITLLFNKDMIPYLFLYLNAFKMFLIFVFTYLWLSTLVKEKWILTIGSIIVTFSGWITFLYHYNLFLDGFVLYPLILWSIDRYYFKKSYLIVLFVALLGLINYYLLYMFVPFIIVYSVLRYFTLEKNKSISSFMNKMFRLLGLGLLALGISSIIVLPSLNVVLSMPRLSNTLSLFDHINIYEAFRYISTLFTPTIEWNNPTYFIAVETNAGYGWGGGISLFCFYLFLLLIPRLFFLKDKLAKRSILFTYGVLFVFAFFIIFYRLFQGTVDVRWYYMFLFMNVYSMTFILKDMQDYGYSKLSIILNSLMTISLMFVFYKITNIKELASIEQISLLKNILIIGVGFIIAYSAIFLLKKIKYMVVIVVFEALFSFLLPLYTNPPIVYETFISQYHSELKSSEAVDYIQSIDDTFYRIVRNGLGAYSLNEPFSNQYKGVTFYESLYSFNTTDFISRFTNNWLLPYTHGRFNTNFLLSEKYYIQENEISSVPFGYDYLTTINNDKIYLNKYYIPLGFSLENTINEDTFKTLPIYDQDQLWLNTIVTGESQNTDYTLLTNKELYASTGDNGYLYLSDVEGLINTIVTIENKGTPYLTINKHYGNNVITEFHYQYDYFQMFIPSDDNFDVFEISAINPYGTINSLNVYVTKDLTVYDTWYDNLNTFKNLNVSKDYISADIDINGKSEWVATSIPYDSGWSVSVDGQKITYSKVNLGFIGFDLESGSHHIEFKYEPPLFKLGLIISALSLIIFSALVICKTKCRKGIN